MQTERWIFYMLIVIISVFLSSCKTLGCCAFPSFGIGILIAFLVTFLWDFWRTRDSSFPLTTSLKKYVSARRLYFIGMSNWLKLQRMTKNMAKSQEQILSMIIDLNKNTEYAKKFDLHKVRSREDLVRIHPVCKYERFAAYHERELNGEENVSTSQTPSFFGVTSGTTGAPSKMPLTPAMPVVFLETIPSLWIYRLGETYPELKKLDRRLGLFYNRKSILQKSTAGIPVGPISALMLNMEDNYTTPLVGHDIADEPSARYIHLLFGLNDRNVTMIESVFCSLVYMGFREMEKSWKDLVHDIRNGKIKETLDISQEQRDELERHLRPNPARGAELQREFEKGFDNIAQRVWPKLKLVYCVTSGVFAHYAKVVREKYTKDIVMFHPIYGATEGILGINLTPRKIDPPEFMVLPYLIVYEFIPLEEIGEKNPKTVFIEQVEIGKDYEVVLTTTAGLYRYRLGDVVRVMSFHNQCPILSILYRTGQMLNIFSERVSDVSLYNAITETVAQLSDKVQSIVDFTSCESVFLENGGQDVGSNVRSPYYVIFLELNLTSEGKGGAKLEDELSKVLDSKLRASHDRYTYQRGKEGLDPPKVFITKPDAFLRLRKLMLEISKTAPSQLKHQRVLRKPQLAQFMLTQRN